MGMKLDRQNMSLLSCYVRHNDLRTMALGIFV